MLYCNRLGKWHSSQYRIRFQGVRYKMPSSRYSIDNPTSDQASYSLMGPANEFEAFGQAYRPSAGKFTEAVDENGGAWTNRTGAMIWSPLGLTPAWFRLRSWLRRESRVERLA